MKLTSLVKIGNFVRMLVRPAVTGALVGTMCYLAIAGNKEMILAIGTLAGVAVNAWFNDRPQQNRPANLGDS